MGTLYELGRGVEIDYEQAAQWYRRAGEKGYAQAQKKLGDLYGWRRGVAKDDVEAERWYRRAAEQKDVRGHKPWACSTGEALA